MTASATNLFNNQLIGSSATTNSASGVATEDDRAEDQSNGVNAKGDDGAFTQGARDVDSMSSLTPAQMGVFLTSSPLARSRVMDERTLSKLRFSTLRALKAFVAAAPSAKMRSQRWISGA